MPFSDGHMHPARSFQYWLKKECKLLGIDNVHPHRLRHALGHHLSADLGFDLLEVKEKLRHATVATTQIYAKRSKEEVDKKIDKEMYKNEP